MDSCFLAIYRRPCNLSDWNVMDWKKVIFGGAGPKLNNERYWVIDRVKHNLDMWRDFDSPSHLEEAIKLLKDAR